MLTLCADDRLKLEIFHIAEINEGINFIGSLQGLTNCSALADHCDGGSALPLSENEMGGGVDKYEEKIKTKYLEILDSKDAQIGDVITYRLTLAWRNGEVSATMSKLGLNQGSMLAPSVEKDIDELYKQKRHFSVVVLLDKTGTAPAFIIPKNGTGYFDFKVDSASDMKVAGSGTGSGFSLPCTDLEYEPTLVDGKTSTIYRRQ